MTDITLLLGYIAGACTTAAFLPQVIRSLRTRSTHDISPVMLLVFSIGLSLWVLYGYAENRMPIIAANLITLVLVGVLVWLWFTENKRQSRSKD
jgi:MtN3 and saliva related transmembrane protein